ncbi:MAG: hypothetical protein IJ420_06200 [Lachnospiraceae bacterium]|nr:hypothetical protein [Lachnospiraceae bacterium]
MNNLELFKQYTTLLDEVYKQSALTADLEGAPELAKQGANANELIIPKLDMSGLGDYDRNSGYVDGDVTLTNETVKCNFDRGRMFNVDNMDNAESAGIAFGRLAGEFIRTKVVPEVDAFRFACYAAKAGISTAVPAVLATGEAVIAALRAAVTKMNEDEVPMEGRILYITPTLKGLVEDLDTTKSREVFKNFEKVVEVPQSRFYTAIEQRDGKSEGETAGGYKKADGAADINFMIVHKPAVIQFTKHKDAKVIAPEANQSSDGWKFGYRMVSIADAYENKVAGIYMHAAPVA